MYVTPIQVGSFRPVCVVAPAVGTFPSAKTERDLERPSIAIFCKRVDDDIRPLLTAMNALAEFGAIRCSVTMTAGKGVLPADMGAGMTYQLDKFFTKVEVDKMLKDIRDFATSSALTAIPIGIAVNHSWSEGVGYADDSDVLVAYVRVKVLSVDNLKADDLTMAKANELVRKLGALHSRSGSRTNHLNQ